MLHVFSFQYDNFVLIGNTYVNHKDAPFLGVVGIS